MTNSELIKKLEQAQGLLSDIYHWASTPMTNGLQVSPLQTNAEIASVMSCADNCIWEAINLLEEEA